MNCKEKDRNGKDEAGTATDSDHTNNACNDKASKESEPSHKSKLYDGRYVIIDEQSVAEMLKNVTKEEGAKDNAQSYKTYFCHHYATLRKPVIIRKFVTVDDIQSKLDGDAKESIDMSDYVSVPTRKELLERYADHQVSVTRMNLTMLLERGVTPRAIEHKVDLTIGELMNDKTKEMWYLRIDPEKGRNARTYWPEMFNRLYEPVIKEKVTKLIMGCQHQTAFYPMKSKARIRSGSKNYAYPLHFDMSHNVAVQLKGTKSFTLFSPDDIQYLYLLSLEDFKKMDGYPFWSHIIDPTRPDAIEKFPSFAKTTPIVGTLYPGDALFIPMLTSHHFRMDEESEGEKANVNKQEDDEDDGINWMVNQFLGREWIDQREVEASIPESLVKFEREHYQIIPKPQRY